ncbi:hypothetical protein J4G33_15210 [Actinotalea sp. BY-33]|uniref:WXG100 family type VII secretion target n=1 Tax=Actinotalea soli TaxID=2819234 RepID=A0A939RX00_9CELL|nr:hypothetical protein [Actinotalea soli]MBO1753158.1 hypothetical protein [Actinotalea soli]
MPIHTEIQGSPTQVRAVATWTRSTLATATGSYADSVTSVRRDAGSDWEGDASDAFRASMLRLVTRADDVEAAARESATELDAFADALDAAQSGMATVRTTAAAAGLRVTPSQVLEPGPAPWVPARPPSDGSAPQGQVLAYNRAVDAHDEHLSLALAYNAAVDEAADVLRAFQTAIDAFGVFLRKVFTAWQSYVDTAVLATELALKRHIGDMRSYAEDLRAAAARAEDAYLRSPGGSTEAQFQERLRLQSTREADTVLRNADELSSGRLARLFGGKIPVVGTVVTVAGVGYDVSQGASPSGAIVGAAAGALATAGVVAVVGGPVGAVAAVGIVAGVGAGMLAEAAWNAWVPDDVKAKIDQGIEDTVNATTDALSDGLDSFTEGVSGVWNAIF